MVSVRIVLDERKAKKDGTYPVKIRIADYKDAQRIGTSISLSSEDFNSMMSSNGNKTLKGYKRKLDTLIAKAYSIIDTLHPFNFKTFNTRFSQKGNRSDLIFLLNNKADELEFDEKYSNSRLYRQSANILSEFLNHTNKSILLISEVTPKWLNSFEKWAINVTRKEKIKGSKDQFIDKLKYSNTTLSMYLIRVRAIFNELISNQEFPSNSYPFHKPDNKNGYKIPKSYNHKRPLEIAEIMNLFNYEPVTKGELFARDTFIFSYLASGINPIDIFRIRWIDIKKDQLTFIRKKTQKKTGGANIITVQLNNYLWDIINRHGTNKLESSYVFDILNDQDTEKEIIRKTRIAIGMINPNLKKIAKKIDVDEGISLYYARHSFSNNLMNSEVPIAFISKQLGHTDIKTTQNYLDSFTSKNAKDYQSNLLDFSKIKD